MRKQCIVCKLKQIGGEEACTYCTNRERDDVQIPDIKLSQLKSKCKEINEKYGVENYPCIICPYGDFCENAMREDFPMNWRIEGEN